MLSRDASRNIVGYPLTSVGTSQLRKDCSLSEQSSDTASFAHKSPLMPASPKETKEPALADAACPNPYSPPNTSEIARLRATVSILSFWPRQIGLMVGSGSLVLPVCARTSVESMLPGEISGYQYYTWASVFCVVVGLLAAGATASIIPFEER